MGLGLDNPLHIALLLVVVLLIFGARRLPEIGRSLGSGIREFKRSVTGESEQATPDAGGAPRARPADVAGTPTTAPLPAPGAQPATPGAADAPVSAPAASDAASTEPTTAERGAAVAAAAAPGNADTRAA